MKAEYATVVEYFGLPVQRPIFENSGIDQISSPPPFISLAIQSGDEIASPLPSNNPEIPSCEKIASPPASNNPIHISAVSLFAGMMARQNSYVNSIPRMYGPNRPIEKTEI